MKRTCPIVFLIPNVRIGVFINPQTPVAVGLEKGVNKNISSQGYLDHFGRLGVGTSLGTIIFLQRCHLGAEVAGPIIFSGGRIQRHSGVIQPHVQLLVFSNALIFPIFRFRKPTKADETNRKGADLYPIHLPKTNRATDGTKPDLNIGGKQGLAA